MKRLLVVVLALAFLLPVAAVAIPNPLRALVPEMFGFICDSNRICVDDAEHLARARDLTMRALAAVRQRVGSSEIQPRLIFCMSEECFNIFGRRCSTSVAFGDKAILIGPRGWESHYIEHELIHVVQYQKLGLLRAWRAPKWLTEGMAYSLSGDPRRPLPGELEAWRTEFERWYQGEKGEILWTRVYEALDTAP